MSFKNAVAASFGVDRPSTRCTVRQFVCRIGQLWRSDRVIVAVGGRAKTQGGLPGEGKSAASAGSSVA